MITGFYVRIINIVQKGILLYNNNSIFQPGHTYELEVHYENAGVSIDTLIVDYTGDKPEVRAPGGDRNGYDRDPEGQTPPDGDEEADSNTGGKSDSSGADRTGNSSPDSDSVTTISTITGEGSPLVAPLDMAENLPSDSSQEPHGLRLNAPAYNMEDGDPSSMRDADQIARPVAIQDIAPDELPDISAAHTEEPRPPAPLPFTLPLTLGGVAGLSCIGLVLLKNGGRSHSRPEDSKAPRTFYA